jgi:hypothetical protein
MITKEELLNDIEYNPETGEFFWKKTKKGRNKDLSAGGRDKDGYIVICINGSQYKAHRLAWIIYHGFAPTEQIDHINKITSDNRICNLRLASQTQNNCNQKIRVDNTSGFKGITFDKQTNKWRASIHLNKKTFRLGRFSDIKTAINIVSEARKKLHGEFACTT